MDWVSTAIGIGSALLKGSGDKGSGDQKPFVQQPPPPDYTAILANVERASPTVTTQEARDIYGNPERKAVTNIREKYEKMRRDAMNRLPEAERTLLAELSRDAFSRTV